MSTIQILILIGSAIGIATACVILQKVIGVEDPLLITGAVTGAVTAMIATKFMRKNKGNN